MKNIHVLPTDKPSRLFLNKVNNKLLLDGDTYSNLEKILPSSNYQHLYITSDDEIKEGDWVYRDSGVVFKMTEELLDYYESIKSKDIHKRYKIILTTDQDLIKDGIQAIDDEFLEWFVKNPSCEEIKTYYIPNEYRYNFLEHKIIIPQFGTKEFNDLANQYFGGKQETLEEVAERHTYGNAYQNFIRGAKWQQERSYSLDEIKTAMKNGYGIKYFSEHTFLKNLNNLKKK